MTLIIMLLCERANDPDTCHMWLIKWSHNRENKQKKINKLKKNSDCLKVDIGEPNTINLLFTRNTHRIMFVNIWPIITFAAEKKNA